MKKKEIKKKEKQIPICIKCLNEVKPTSLQWVYVKDSMGAEFQICICDDCLEKKEQFSQRYEVFQIVGPYQKKREYKKKNKDA